MISIVVPIFNSEKWLHRCINSLIKQTYKDIEIILVNDGSSDKSLEICKEYAFKDNRIIVIDKANGGVSSARNTGIKAAKGEFIQFVDSDDYIDSDMCEQLFMAISNSEMVICGLKVWQKNRLLRQPHLESQNINYREDINKYFELRKINLGPCNKLYRKDKISDLFNENLTLGEDTLFVLDYMKNITQISVLSNCLYNVVLDNENSLNRKPKTDKMNLLVEQRESEENFLLEVYGANCDLTHMYNTYLLLLHAIFLESIKISDTDFKEKLSQNVKNPFLQYRVKKSAPKRIDYKVFRFLFIHKLNVVLYIFFVVKNFGIK